MKRKICALLAALCLTASGCGTETKSEAPDLEPLAEDGSNLLTAEALGDLQFGQTEAQVETSMGQPDAQTESEIWAADGRAHTTWSYDGAEITFADGSVESVSVTSPFSGTTQGGVGLGSDAADIQEAYGALIDSEISTEDWIVVGSVYGGLAFTLEDGTVARVDLGVLAE